MRQRCAKELWPNEAAATIESGLRVAEEERRILMTTKSSSSMESSVHSNSAFCGWGCGASELPGRLDAVESGISAAEGSKWSGPSEKRGAQAEIKAGPVGLCIDRDATRERILGGGAA